MLTAPNLHQFAHEDKARRARHAEIDVRYAWLARQSGAWPAGESRKYPRGSPQLLCRIRLRELEALYGARYGGTLPYDDAGIDDLKIAAHHIGHMGGDAIGHIVAWADMWMPDLPRERAKAIARDIVDDPVKFKAATLAWRLRLTEQERTTLGIKTIRPFGVSDADMKERRKAKRRERERERRRRRSKPKKAPLRETRPWQDLGISRSTWYRRNPGRRGETKPCGQQVPLSTNMQASQFVSLAQQRKKAIRAGTDHPEVCPSRKAAAKSLGRRRDLAAQFLLGQRQLAAPSKQSLARGVSTRLVGAAEQPCRHNDDGALTMSPFVLSTMANNSLCSASGTLNFAIVSSKSLQKASHSLSVILRCLWDSLMERPV